MESSLPLSLSKGLRGEAPGGGCHAGAGVRCQEHVPIAGSSPGSKGWPLAVGLAKWSVWGAFWFRHARQEDRICETLHAPKRAKSEQPAHCPFQVLAEREDEKCQNSIIH